MIMRFHYKDILDSHFSHHLLRLCKISSRSFVLVVNAYSTFSGISGYIFFVIKPSCSSSDNLSDKTVLLIPFRLLFNSLNLTTFLILKFFNISNDHLLPRTSQISNISHFSTKVLVSDLELRFFIKYSPIC